MLTSIIIEGLITTQTQSCLQQRPTQRPEFLSRPNAYTITTAVDLLGKCHKFPIRGASKTGGVENVTPNHNCYTDRAWIENAQLSSYKDQINNTHYYPLSACFKQLLAYNVNVCFLYVQQVSMLKFYWVAHGTKRLLIISFS